MGHKRLSWIRKSKTWNKIIGEMGSYALGQSDISLIAQNTLKQVQKQYSTFENDPSIKTTFEFLLHLSYAFQQKEPIKYLNEHNIIDSEEISMIKLSRAATKYKNDDVTSHEYQTFAKQAVIDAISQWYKSNLEEGRSLFYEHIDSNVIFNKAADGGGFSELSRLYFAKITERYLKYFLDREAAVKIPNIAQRNKFAKDIEEHIAEISKHAFETTKITQSFAAGWYNKNTKNSFPEDTQIKYFLNKTMGKMKSELLREEKK